MKDEKVVGVFHGWMCSIYSGDVYIGALSGLEYCYKRDEYDNKGLYANDSASVWLDYARYE